MGDIRVQCLSPHSRVMKVLLHYEIDTHYPSGYTDRHDQRLHYTWCEKRETTAAGTIYRPEIVCLHISNAWRYDEQDVIYPVHYENVTASRPAAARQELSVTVRATDGCVHRIPLDRILYIATVKRAAKLLLHLESGAVAIRGTLSQLEQQYPSYFLRIHSGYLINPAHARRIRRFAVTLSDGTELPLPEKKYTQIKRRLSTPPPYDSGRQRDVTT